MSERLNIKVGAIGARPSSHIKKTMTLKDAINLIKQKQYPENIENNLIEMLKKRPSNTYEHFFKNIYTHLKRLENEKS